MKIARSLIAGIAIIGAIVIVYLALGHKSQPPGIPAGSADTAAASAAARGIAKNPVSAAPQETAYLLTAEELAAFFERGSPQMQAQILGRASVPARAVVFDQATIV
ncbi:MAG TPA: hypothetical protein VII85_03270, partial [Candidatus Krumholzibacteriaceae bacterium]